MALTRRERAALEELRKKVVLERASLTPPKRAIERGYPDWDHSEPVVRPLARPGWEERNPDLAGRKGGDQWTNDVAESLRIYTESWILPIIDALLAGDARELAELTDMPLTTREYIADRKRRAS